MATKLMFRQALYCDVEALCEHVREADRREVEATHGSVHNAIMDSIARSDFALAAYMGDEILGICGCVPVNLCASIGNPWWISAEAVERYPKTFVRASRMIIDMFHQQYDHLQNFVDMRYIKSLNWLRIIGFRIDHNVTERHNNVRFVMVRSEKSDGSSSAIRRGSRSGGNRKLLRRKSTKKES